MTESEFEQQFAKAWGAAMSEEELNKLTQNAVADNPDPITSVTKILIEYQLCTAKAVLKEFLLNGEQQFQMWGVAVFELALQGQQLSFPTLSTVSSISGQSKVFSTNKQVNFLLSGRDLLA